MTKRNFILLTLGDNDFGEHMRYALEHIKGQANLEKHSDERLKEIVIQMMVGHSIATSARVHKTIDWDRFKRTEKYLTEKLEVSSPRKLDNTIDHDGGAACIDLRLDYVTLL